jgi:hypothetical protein
MRPNRTLASQAPGTVRHVARGLCATCHTDPAIRDAHDSITHHGTDLIEDASDLLAAGESETAVARRLGVSAAAIAQAAHRHGRPDVASRFDRARRLERRAS